MQKIVSMEIGGRTFSIETGRVAKQANGSVLVRYGDSVILVTAVWNTKPDPKRPFLPLLVEYREKSYAAGRCNEFSRLLCKQIRKVRVTDCGQWKFPRISKI